MPEAEVVAVLVTGHADARRFQPAALSTDIRLPAEPARPAGVAHRVEIVLRRIVAERLGQRARVGEHRAALILLNVPRRRMRQHHERRDGRDEITLPETVLDHEVADLPHHVVAIALALRIDELVGKSRADVEMLLHACRVTRRDRPARFRRSARRAFLRDQFVFKSGDVPAAA